jgi:hypothetical protein
VIEITYEKNDELLDAVNRIHKYYAPSEGMAGEDLGQLMTGVDFGGVQVQGNTFEVTGGWDALPWFTDSWDSVESNNDVYIQVDGSTTTVTLPAPPAPNERISVYLQRAGNTKAMRIDDPHFNIAGDSAMVINPNALMPTIIGDGSTVTYAIDEYFNTYPGDTLIFRAFDSDGSVVINDTDGTIATVTSVAANTLGLSANIFTATGKSYSIYGMSSREGSVLYVGTGGTLSITTWGGQTVTMVGVVSGSYVPVQVARVNATGTSASNIIAFW